VRRAPGTDRRGQHAQRVGGGAAPDEDTETLVSRVRRGEHGGASAVASGKLSWTGAYLWARATVRRLRTVAWRSLLTAAATISCSNWVEGGEVRPDRLKGVVQVELTEMAAVAGSEMR
jgi:hypothetical protein